jgi:hypothetical protein
MPFILIAVQSNEPSRSYSDLGKRLQERGDDCHTMDNVWIVDTLDSPQEIESFLLDGIIDSRDSFIIVPIRDPWICYNSPTDDDCERFYNAAQSVPNVNRGRR